MGKKKNPRKRVSAEGALTAQTSATAGGSEPSSAKKTKKRKKVIGSNVQIDCEYEFAYSNLLVQYFVSGFWVVVWLWKLWTHHGPIGF